MEKMMPQLVLITARGVKLVDLSGGRLTIGRSSKCDLSLDQPLLSRIHALVSAEEGGFSIRDLDSRNGTYVNGVRVRQTLLRHHDTIRIGDCEMRYLDAPVKSQPGLLSLAN
jgi:pSer/pThr/pTyr-binding forkhead associated (FHA) protein